MDIRIEKTKNSIREAFLELRMGRPLEKIKVKELCELARVNKSTFYSHYTDIYDLSEQLENEAVQEVLSQVECPGELLTQIPEFIYTLFHSYASKEKLLHTLFSGNRSSLLIDKISKGIKELIFQGYPQYREDVAFNTALSYHIYGAYHAFRENRGYGEEKVVTIIGSMGRGKILPEEKSDESPEN